MTFTKKHKQVLQSASFLAPTAALLWLSFRGIQWKSLWQGVLNAGYMWIGVVLVISIAAYFVRAQRWRLLIAPMGYRPTLANTYRAVIIGYLANFVFPRLGEVARCGTLVKSNSIPFNKLVGTVVAERLFDLICLIMLLTAGVIVRAETFAVLLRNVLFERTEDLHLSTLFAAAAGAGTLAVAALLWLLLRKKSHPLSQKIRKFLRGAAEGFGAFLRMRRRWEFIGYTVLLWFCYYLMAWLALYAIRGFAHFGALDGLLAMLLGSLGIVAPVNGGLGAYHAILRIGMPFLFGVAVEDALLYATLSHESQLLSIVILGLIAYVKVFFRKSPTNHVRTLP